MTDRIDMIRSIGDTPLVELRRIVPKDYARLLVKVESQNPTGSMKDRMALSVVDSALASGQLSPAGTIVEYTAAAQEHPSHLYAQFEDSPLRL